MADKLTSTVNKTLGTNASPEALFNSTVKAMPESTSNLLPEYQRGQDFRPWGETFDKSPHVFNDYLSTLAIKYGGVFIKSFIAQNPLAFFKRGKMPYGGKLETVVFDVIKPKLYRPDLIDGDENPYAQNFGRVMGHTYTHYQDIESTNTVVDTQDTMFFQNLKQFNNFIYGKVSQLVNGAILDEYFQTKQTLSASIAQGLMTKDDNAGTGYDNFKELARRILYWSKKLRYFDTDSNAIGYNQATRVEDIVVILPVNSSINMDVDYFANVFNAELTMDKKPQYLEVDKFPDIWTYDKDHVVTQEDITGHFVDPREHPVGSTVKAGALAFANAVDATQKLIGDQVGAVVLDRDALQLWDALPTTLSTLANPKKRYTNLFLNKKTMLMFVQALNSKAIMMSKPAVNLK